MKIFLKKKYRRLAAMIVCALLVVTALPVTAFAWTGGEGQACVAKRGERYVSADGGYYYCPVQHDYILYDENGNISFHSMEEHATRRKFLLEDGEGTHQVYCLEAGVDFGVGSIYGSENGENSRYFKNLPMTAQFGIMLALLYGYQEGKAMPVAGANTDDYAFATQTLIWEYQQQLRTSPADLQSANGVAAGMYYNQIVGRPAQLCYDWILTQMAAHYTVPSFASRNQNTAATYTLKYDPDTGKYSTTLEDTNQTLSDIRFSEGGITVTRNGSRYTFTSDHMITSPVSVSAQKAVSQGNDKLLIWGSVGKQTMVSGISDPVYFYFNLVTETTGTGRIVKYSEDGVISGVCFTVSGNGVTETVTTGKDGTVDLELMPGVYTVTEQSADRYEPQATKRITIVSGQTATVTFQNELKRGGLEVRKTSEDGLVEGMTFHLSGTSLSGQAVDEYAVTDKNGVARFEDVLIGSGYVLEEVDTPDRYVVPDSQSVAINWNEVTQKSVANILKKFRVTVTKSDAETGTSQGDGTLAGAVYGLYKGSTLIDSFTTDENGQFTTGYYVCDSDWTIREISPSEGYLLDSTVYKVGAEPQLYEIERNDTANDVTEQVIKGDIAIIKHTDDGGTQIETPESGAEFQIFLKSADSYENARESERDVLVCDENGFAQSKKLPYGTYIVHQTKGWEGRELMDDFEVYIAKDNQTYRYLINNANFASFIKVVKVDVETGAVIPYAGAGFQIYRPDGSKVEMTFTYPTPTTIDTFYTNNEGYLVTPETLEYGFGYSLVEVQAPYGYVLDSTPVYFDVTEDNSTEEDGVTVVKVTKENTAQKGIIKVSKTGEVFSSVTGLDGMYQPVYEAQGLAGAVFEITALEDIYTLDGTLRYSAGEVVDTITTGEDGTAQSQPLYLGRYQVKEIGFPHGMVDTGGSTTNVELVYAGQEVEVTETSASLYNQRQKVRVTLNKVLEQDETFGIGMNGEISAVTFGLYAQEDIIAADGSVIPADGLLEIVSVKENGQALCATDLPFGSFYLKELSTDSHYLLNGETFPFTFEYGGPSVTVVEILANDGEVITNELIRGEIQGMKTDENGTGLGGALIGLFRTDETEYIVENALATTTSAEDGSFSFSDVPYGNWVLKELESPEGFLFSDEIIPVTVKEDGQIVEISLSNKQIRGNLRLTKVDKDYPDNKLTGAEFEVYRDTNGNKELDEGDELLGQMEETSTGIYEMSHILYGGVFVKETKAPEGFLLDEHAYYVAITENGKIYEVENEAGIGFVNLAQTGSLRIEKTSSDGRVEGFSFRVTGANGYEQIFITDANGEIFIEGLRVGDYTVSEVSDSTSASYVLPADKTVTIFADKTTVAQMHNELKDTPKTGDNGAPWLWMALMGVFAAGAVALGVTAYVSRRRKNRDSAE